MFDEKENFRIFDEKEENEVVEIPDPIIDQIDDDLPMNETDREDFIDRALSSRDGA